MSGKIRFTMETETENDLEFFDLRHKLKTCTKIMVDAYSKPTASVTYVYPTMEYIRWNIFIPLGIPSKFLKVLL